MAEGELGWDGELDENADSAGFKMLPPGEYPFKVKSFERARFHGSAKLPPCNQAKLTICIDGQTTVVHNLFLHEKTKGLLCDFFVAIGQRKHNEQFVMNWPKVVGATGRCKVSVRKWTGDDKLEHESNDIKKFIDPEKHPVAPEAKNQPTPETAPAPLPDDLPF